MVLNRTFSSILVLVAAISTALLQAPAAQGAESISFLHLNESGNCDLRLLVQSPEGETKADLLFFIGYGDRVDNHKPLFDSLSEKGVRVISFDYPQHGESRCGSLDMENFTTLSDYAELIERATREESKRPLFLSGWSTGGLLAVRMVQTKRLSSRPVAGLALLAPGLSVYPFVGGDGVIRQETLLSNPNPPHRGPIEPTSPLQTPVFSTALLLNALLARRGDFPMNLPTLVIVGGDNEDLYAKTKNVKAWGLSQRAKGRVLTGIQCAKAKHELDNEIEPIGSEVRFLVSEFVSNPLNPKRDGTVSCGPIAP